MDRKKLIFATTIILLVLFAFDIQAVHSSPVSTLQSPPSFLGLNNTSTVAPNNDTGTPLFEAQQSFWTFLIKVAGINANSFNVTMFRVTPAQELGSQKTQTAISAIISKNQENVSIAMLITEGKITFYKADLLSGSLEGSLLDTSSALSTVRNAIIEYENNFNASYCNGFDQLVPATVQTSNTTINSEKTLLNVQVSNYANSSLEFANLAWYNKIGNLTIPAQSIQATVAQTGVLTTFVDNLGLYKVATTNTITKDDAISIGMKSINTYATENGLTETSVDSKLSYVSDINGTRGDSFLVYPIWKISAELDNSQKEIYGYSVYLWADSGMVRNQGVDQHNLGTTPPNQYLLVITVIIAFGFISIMAYSKKQAKTRGKQSFLKIGGALVLISLMCALMLTQTCSAYPSSIYGITSHPLNTPPFDQTELNLQSQLTTEISYLSSQYCGYTSYNYYGSGTIANNLYIGASDHGDIGSIVYYFGHGEATNPYGLYTEDNNWVTADQIYSGSTPNSEQSKFAYIDACEQGDGMGTDSMAWAWLHTTSESSDGYHNPDYSSKCYISWSGTAPWLEDTTNGVSDAGYWFTWNFYTKALQYGFNVNDALDLATQTNWQVNFGNGNDPYYWGWSGYGHMVVFGQGTLYLGNEAYVSNWLLMGGGIYSQVTNPDNLRGSQNDNQYTGLVAILYGQSYAWITASLNREATGYVHLWGCSSSAYSHLIVYVSEDNNNWYTLFNGNIASCNPRDIYCGQVTSQFRYIAITVQNDQGNAAYLAVDAVHVYG